MTTRGRASGNLIAYTIDEETEEVTFQPASLDGGNWVNGDSKTYTMAAGNFFGTQVPNETLMLAEDLDKGDVDLYYQTVDNLGEPSSKIDSVGIDEDTIVYYYDGKDGSVVKGYSSARLAVRNATSLKLSDNQMGVGSNSAKIVATTADAEDYICLWVYSNSDSAARVEYKSGKQATDDTEVTLGSGSTIVIGVKDMSNDQTVSYYAYIVE